MPRRGISVFLKIIKEVSEFYRKSEFPEQFIKSKILYLLLKSVATGIGSKDLVELKLCPKRVYSVITEPMP